MPFTVKSEKLCWNPSELARTESDSIGKHSYCLLVLTHSLEGVEKNEKDIFHRLWSKAKVKISIDGGTNSLHDLYPSYIPDIISGDFDSIRKPLLEHYRILGTTIVETPDQDETDFTKALFVLNEKFSSSRNGLKCDFIVALWQPNHRLDHIFAVINTLHKWSKVHPKCPIFLMDLKGSISWLMVKGKHEVTRDAAATWCSLVPFDGSAVITSKGLVYDMDATCLSFGSLISTSNGFHPKFEKVSISVESSPILWLQGRCLS